MSAEGATIAAISSPPGPGRRGVIRVSGRRAAELVRATFAVASGSQPELGARGLAHGRFDDGAGTQPALLLWMPGPRSYTGEDVAELHLPGSPPLLRAALAHLLALGAEPAGPGAFTRRAFLNGRLDLTRAEGVLELVQASDEAERRAAAVLLDGGLAHGVELARERLADLRALCEASLDFDEADTGHVPEDELHAGLDLAEQALDATASLEQRREPPAGLPRIVLAGAPNAGKSTLFNALVAHGQALVSELAGTTREGATGALELAGVTCVLADAPGLDPAAAGQDARAQELALRARAGADLVLWVVDATRRDTAELAGEAAALAGEAPRVLVWSQVDRPDAAPLPPPVPGFEPLRAVAVSAVAGTGMARLREATAEALGLSGRGAARTPSGALSRELSVRHRAALAEARAALARARGLVRAHAPLDLAAEALREATVALDDLTGRTTPEDVLDRIFARFCIGK